MSTTWYFLPVEFEKREEDLLKAGQLKQSERHLGTEPAVLAFPAADVTERPPPIPVLEVLALSTSPSCEDCRETSDVRDETLLGGLAPEEATWSRGCLDRVWDLVIIWF